MQSVRFTPVPAFGGQFRLVDAVPGVGTKRQVVSIDAVQRDKDHVAYLHSGKWSLYQPIYLFSRFFKPLDSDGQEMVRTLES